MSYYIITATAGHDTTSNTTVGALHQLALAPDQFAMLKGDLGHLDTFFEEAVRWVTPVKSFIRTAAQDTEVRGQKIAKGENLLLCYPSANRDEEVFDEPFRFKVDRNPNPHLAFGIGPHMCLGRYLAGLEVKEFYAALLPRLDSVELTGTPEYTEAQFVSGLKRLPIRYRMR